MMAPKHGLRRRKTDEGSQIIRSWAAGVMAARDYGNDDSPQIDAIHRVRDALTGATLGVSIAIHKASHGAPCDSHLGQSAQALRRAAEHLAEVERLAHVEPTSFDEHRKR